MNSTYDINSIYPVPLVMGTPIERTIELDEDLTCTVTEGGLVNTSKVFFGEVD